MEDLIVEAIEDGQIVSVHESYARREGLVILRKSASQQPSWAPQNTQKPSPRKTPREESRPLFDDFRKPLHVSQDNVTRFLVPNFHWIIREKRRILGLTRKKCAHDLGVSENDLKLLENGIYPSKEFGLANKLSEYFGSAFLKPEANSLSQDFRKLVEKSANLKPVFEKPAVKPVVPIKSAVKDSAVSDSNSLGIEGLELDLSGDEIEIDEKI